MSSNKALKNHLEETQSIKLVAQALGEIATVKLKSTRERVMQNTLFFKEVAEVYHTLKVLAARRRLMHPNQTTFSNKNGHSISILLSSNYHFYGGLDNELTDTFIKTTGKYATDRLVIGKFGRDYLTSLNYPLGFENLIFKTDSPNLEELRYLVNKAIPYSEIYVYHSKFVTVLKQESEISDIGESQAKAEAAAVKIDYILEPELDKMLIFFENQILISLFQSIFLESELAKTAARMNSMYQAETNADKTVKELRTELFKARRLVTNIRILETYAGTRNLLS